MDLFSRKIGHLHANYLVSGSKGQLNSELIHDVIVSPKMPTKNLKDFSNYLQGQKFLVGILGEMMTS